MEKEKIYIIGAGLSGLVTALELERAGFSPVILESSDRIGGRIKTDQIDGFLLDQGFQILNTAYPELNRYLDLNALHLKEFDAGAIIFKGKECVFVNYPLRNPLKGLGMAFSKVGTFSDKMKMFRLTLKLKKKTVEAIFEEESIPTHQYLTELGFSDLIIENFFMPFFRGIFLEKHLNTSSRIFEFLFKMFATGKAAIPERGMGEIPAMLRSQLSRTQIYFDTPVDRVDGKSIRLKNGEIIESDRIVIAVQPDLVMRQLQGQFSFPRRAITLYFSLQRSFISEPIIGLVARDRLINNFTFLTDVASNYSTNGRALLCVTVLESSLDEEELIKAVLAELEEISGISGEYFRFVKAYHIDNALPFLEDPKYSIPMTECKITDHVFLAGDYLLYGSINAAMNSGRTAAEAVVHSYMPTH
jgi:protoporphyrinogen oxidase